MNLNGARLICNQLGVDDTVFFEAVQSFRGASKRLEKVAQSGGRIVFKDFAHAPSKVKATLMAVKEQFTEHKVIACLELHTYSSLNKEFLGHYRGVLDPANTALVYFNPHALKIKRLPEITEEQVKEGFASPGMEVYTSSKALTERLMRESHNKAILLMMSSGNYDGLDLSDLGSHWVKEGTD
jgi:UDP-N-acetylmuramate: L-alanyl-gamma-D-glutamyl-meso-diaminopimelate ligase